MATESVAERMASRLRELEAQDERLRQQLDHINKQREAVSQEVNQLHIALALIEQYEAEDNQDADTLPLPIPLTGTIADAAAEVLRQHGGELDLSRIHDALKAAGKLRPSPNSRTTLWKTLARKRDMFAKAGDGRWRLIGQDLADDDPEVTFVTG